MSVIGGMHIGRAWEGTQFEQDCPCMKAPCGLVDSGNTSPDCLQHQITKTIRQGHTADRCPATVSEACLHRPRTYSSCLDCDGTVKAPAGEFGWDPCQCSCHPAEQRKSEEKP